MRSETRRTLLRFPGMYSWLEFTKACTGTVTSTSRPSVPSSRSDGPYRASRIIKPV